MPVTCETSKQNVGHVPTMVLSGTRGPLLFQVIREGLESGVRLGARGTTRLTLQLRLALEPECLSSGQTTAGIGSTGWNGTMGTLKLFVGSDIWRRSLLLSSRRSG
jgi:hypothetical protein